MYRLKTLSLAKIKHLSWQNNTQISLYGQAPGCAVLSEHKADKIKGTVQSNAKKSPRQPDFHTIKTAKAECIAHHNLGYGPLTSRIQGPISGQ
jgi:hypothetical protein